MRTLYRNMTGNDPTHNYGDFGYHFLIDEAGAVYEAGTPVQMVRPPSMPPGTW